MIDLGRIAGLPPKQESGPYHRGRAVTAARTGRRGGPAVSGAVGDCLLALLVLGLALASLVGRVSQVRLTPSGSVGFRQADLTGIVLLLLGTLALVLRRRFPLPVLLVSGAAFALYQGLDYAPPPLPFAPLVALYTVAAGITTAVSAAAAGVLLAGVAWAGVADGPATRDQLLAYLLSVPATWALGYVVRLSRSHTALLEEQAERMEREQVARTRLAVREEQARIARELHDIVAHNLSVIVAQAGAARRAFAGAAAEPVQHVLGAIESTGREALAEMRRLLGVLGSDQDQDPEPGRRDGGGASPSPALQPTLDLLPELVAKVRGAGLPVELRVEGERRALPAGIELCAYRIVQEALTNTLKHAGAARATVTVTYQPDVLELRIDDDGQGSAGAAAGHPWTAPPGSPARSAGVLTPGHGLVGMRQRAALLGGELAVGPGPDGGFQVVARLPLNGVPSEDPRWRSAS